MSTIIFMLTSFCQESILFDMKLKILLTEIKSSGIKDQKLADMLSVDGDSVNQCLIYKWREGVDGNELIIKRYNRLLEIHRKLKRQKKIK